MKSFTGKFTSVRGWALLLALLLGAGMFISACGDEEVPAPTTPPPAPAPAPAPAPTPEPEPAGPATPENLRVTGRTENSITWSWNAVEDVAGYQGQFSTDAAFAGTDPTFLITAPATSHTVSNLSGNTTGHFRVRSGTGAWPTAPTYGDWSEGVSGRTEAPPAATALSAPTGLSTGTTTNNSVALSWNEVEGAADYEVQRQPADGTWAPASCGGGDSRVTGTQCEVTGLERGTSYSFRVRAHPASDDDTRLLSGWTSSVSTSTSGSAPREPVMGGDDTLSITWESDAASITWFWDAASDNRITHIYALLTPGTPSRPACPALTATTGEGRWRSDMEYAVALRRTQRADDSTPLEPGDVVGLCVRRTWMDDQDNVQYGPVSVEWAATSPKAPATADLGLQSTEIQPGVKDDPTRRTNAIDWFVEMDMDFTYEVRTVSATIADPSELGSCADDGTGNTNLKANTDNAHERFRLSTLSTYTEYKACVRAVDPNARGQSGWTELPRYQTLPAAPGSVSGSRDVETGAANVTGSIAWSFGSSGTLPEQPDGYEAFVYDNAASALAAAQGGTDPVVTLTVDTCDGTDTATSVQETGKGFRFPQSGLSFQRATNAQKAYTVTVLACVRAKLDDNQRTSPMTPDGPWRIGTTTVAVPKLTQ